MLAGGGDALCGDESAYDDTGCSAGSRCCCCCPSSPDRACAYWGQCPAPAYAERAKYSGELPGCDDGAGEAASAARGAGGECVGKNGEASVGNGDVW